MRILLGTLLVKKKLVIISLDVEIPVLKKEFGFRIWLIKVDVRDGLFVSRNDIFLNDFIVSVYVILLSPIELGDFDFLVDIKRVEIGVQVFPVITELEFLRLFFLLLQ